MRAIGVAFVAMLLFSALGSATLRIAEYTVEIAVEADNTLLITEEMAVDFFSEHHGILRAIPVSYRRPTGERLKIDVEMRSVAMDGEAVPVSASGRGGELRLRIGDANSYVIGRHVYTVRYAVRRALLFREEYVQLYWNAIGHATDVPVGHAQVRVVLPGTVDLQEVPTTSYVGYEGSSARGTAASIGADGALLFEAWSLAPREGMTIDIAIPREASGLTPPSFGERVVWFLGANLYAVLPLAALLAMFGLWWRVGRDPRVGTIPPAFAPPRGMHAGHIGVLADDRADLRDLSAMVVGLAVNGYLQIVEDEEGAKGGRTPADYLFRRLRSADGLTRSERVLFEGMFNAEHPDERRLSSMEHEFYKVLPEIKSRLYGELIDRRCYPHNPERVRGTYLTAGGLLGAGGVALGVFFGSLYLGVAVALCGAVVLTFARWMPRKTGHGVDVLREVRGLAEYIRRAEVDRIEFHNAPEKSPQLFEALLPYAMALDLTSIWTRQFEGLFDQPPQWYVGAEPVFRGHLFAASLLHLSSGMHRTFASVPRTQGKGRSAWGGGSGFGGGFSGGGFGGGGVSGW